jgi:hypothetical protein
MGLGNHPVAICIRLQWTNQSRAQYRWEHALAKIIKPAGPWGKRVKRKRSWLVSELYRFLAATAFFAIVIGYFYFDEILPEVRDWL